MRMEGYLLLGLGLVASLVLTAPLANDLRLHFISRLFLASLPLAGVVWVYFHIAFLMRQRKKRQRDARFQQQLEKLAAQGVASEYVIEGSNSFAVLDTHARLAAFGIRDEEATKIVPFEMFQDYTWEWVASDNERFKNDLKFFLNDINTPFVKVGNLSESSAELWLGRLPLIVKSGESA